MPTIKETSEEEKLAAIRWLRDETLLKDVAKELDCVGSSPGIYIRLCRALKQAYKEGRITIA